MKLDACRLGDIEIYICALLLINLIAATFHQSALAINKEVPKETEKVASEAPKERTTRPLDLNDLAAPTFTTFTARDGVPDSVVVALATDAEGFVWLASSSGLARYDGHHWEHIPAPQFGQAVDLFLDHNRTLWVALYDKGLARFDGIRWHVENRKTGLPTNHFRRFLETRDGAGRVETWGLSVDAGLVRRVDAGWQVDPGNAQLPRGVILGLARSYKIGGHPRLWVGTLTEGIWYREDGGDWQPFRAKGFEPSQIEDLLVTQYRGQEELWIAAFGTGLWRLTDEGLSSWTVESGDLRSNRVYRLAVTALPDGDRIIWTASRSGLVRVHGGKVQIFDRRHGLPSNVIRNLHVWHSPSGFDILWIATETGVARVISGANPWRIASFMGSNAIGVFGVLVEPDGRGGERLWVASTQDGLGLYQDGRWQTFSASNGQLPGSDLRFIKRAPDEAGRPMLWIGLEGGELLRVNEDGPRFDRISTPWDKNPGQAVMDILTRKVSGRYEQWIATRQNGIYRWRESRWTPFLPETAVFPWRTTKLLEQIDLNGRSWLWATTNQGLARFDGANWKLFGVESGLPDPDLLGLTLMPDRDGRAVLWAGSSRAGIVRIDVSDPLNPRVLPTGELPKPPDPNAYSALRDSKGRIYICTNNGVQQLVPESSGGFRERVFGRRDGMVHEECNTNAQSIDAHDRYWVGTLGGLAVYDPDSDVPDRQPKELKLTHARIDGVEVTPAALRVPPHVRELRFDFALLSWQRENESRFRTQLVGYDSQPGLWVPQNHRQFGALPPGLYLLRVEARDYTGLESRPLEITFQVLPAWWQQLWFRSAVVAFFALAGPLFYLYRVRRLSRQKAELQRIVESRTAELEKANARLSELSRQDSLTGVANRRHLDEALDEEWRRAVRLKIPLSFLLLDVDHFKAYNDHLGHQAGDACLEAVARALADAHTRAGELVARYGGEEFGVLIPGATSDAAVASAENVRIRVINLALPHPSSDAGSVVTVSIGVASTQPIYGMSPADLVRAADRALYLAKQEGRNCVRVSEYLQKKDTTQQPLP